MVPLGETNSALRGRLRNRRRLLDKDVVLVITCREARWTHGHSRQRRNHSPEECPEHPPASQERQEDVTELIVITPPPEFCYRLQGLRRSDCGFVVCAEKRKQVGPTTESSGGAETTFKATLMAWLEPAHGLG